MVLVNLVYPGIQYSIRYTFKLVIYILVHHRLRDLLCSHCSHILHRWDSCSSRSPEGIYQS